MNNTINSIRTLENKLLNNINIFLTPLPRIPENTSNEQEHPKRRQEIHELKLVCYNARSVTSTTNKYELQKMIHSLKYDVILINETWSNEDI